ncbi:MAG: aminotransferase class I/II-fold pyridoxal phosphate-dependent enzyme [Chlorobi bacterium]|nr:aminotransferase class I/II-fold pyridoxal phosphate-dependent enzyme [Chlorobiota bacterium]
MKTRPRHRPADEIQDLQFFGEFGGVNPSISDSATYTFLRASTMTDTFAGETEGCYLYSRHSHPSGRYLATALARVENTPSALVTASGMGAITSTLLHHLSAGDHLVSARTVYGGTYAFMKNFLPKLGIRTTFVDITKPEKVEAAVEPNTKLIYTETVSNPLLEVADIPALAAVARKHRIPLVVDNTFTPLIFTPAELGADIVIHSLTKFINGMNDLVAGCVCGSRELIEGMLNVNDGAAMLLGPVLDSIRAAEILKNLHTLPVRMAKHSANAMYLAREMEKRGIPVRYPGLPSHPQHELFKRMMNPEFGFGGMLTLDLQTADKAARFMEELQAENVGYLAVSLGYFKTLFNAPGKGTSSEIPEEEQARMGLSDGLIRMSVGLDFDITRTLDKILRVYERVQSPEPV